MKRIKKIKYDGVQMYLEYHISKPNDEWEEVTLKSYDKPTSEFKDELYGLKEYFEDICELPKGYSDTITVKGVSFSYGGPEETMGAVLVGSKILNTANAPLNLNTPHLPSEDYNGNENDKILPILCTCALERLIDLAIAYIEGDRDFTGSTESMFENDKVKVTIVKEAI